MDLQRETLLEILDNDHERNLSIPLIEVGENRFVIKNKDCYLTLFEILKNWCVANALMNEKMYKDMLESRIKAKLLENSKISGDNTDLNFLTEILSNHTNPTQNKPFDIETNLDKPNYLFISGRSNTENQCWCLNQWDIQNKTIVKDYGPIHSLREIRSITVTNNQKYLFTSDFNGNLKQWDIQNQELVKGYVCVQYINNFKNTRINSLTTTSNNKYLFASNNKGSVIQLDIEQQKVIKKYEQIHSSEIESIAATNDNRYLFTSDVDGYLKQYDIEQRRLVKDYRKVHNGEIWSIEVTYDSRFLFTSDDNGSLKQWHIENQRLLKDYGQILFGDIKSISVTKDNQYLFISGNTDGLGCLKQYDIDQQKLVKDYGPVHLYKILSITISSDSRYLFTSDCEGYVYQFDIQKRVQVRECPNTFNRIMSITST